jgi:tRNA pseudouridine38-40 synthase
MKIAYKMHYYKITIQYEGTNYAGFQWQSELQTVQSELNTALSKLLPGKVTTMAASRTDTGVHAIEQIVKVTTENSINLSTFIKELNLALPKDIRCNDIIACTGLFRPASETISKEYRYFFTNKTKVIEEDRQFIANISNVLDIEAMNFCTRALIGTHDFCNFYSTGSNVKSTVRNISFCDLSLINPHTFFSDQELFKIPKSIDHCFELRIEANGFLKQMIRHIVSALWLVGSGKLSTENFIELLNGPKKGKQIWKVASPNGLFLYRIKY